MHLTKNKYPDCKKCEVGFVELNEENYFAVGLIDKYGINVFLNGMGGINTNAIMNILELEEVINKKELFEQLITYLSSALSARNVS